ncbi:MAG TPA: methylated-DNA--[protein]-cysteine S-methyltransferase [Gemmatimonadaceae bacterium]|nr:methylated-DNA--[protein]-cysteine S-methyltransferase [Gemmatimonadaceae bacterium]
MIVYDTLHSPVGELLLTANDVGLTGIDFEPHSHSRDARAEWDHATSHTGAASAILAVAREQLTAYFAGTRTVFDLPLAARGTPFQLRVWTALRDIAFGESISYGELARRLGVPRAVRAVGGANGRNPIPIVVPCHRVIGADGSLTGFGGGIERKRWLLRHEGALLV